MKKLDLIDMHTHTCFSDGELTPNELLIKAEQEGIKTLAITDHDTLLGVQNITTTLTNIELINGIEITIKVPSGTMHILGYDIDIWNNQLNKKVQEFHTRSIYSVMGIICQLKKDYNISFSSQEIQEIINTKGNIGRPDIARLLIKYGYVKDIYEAFDKYLIDAYAKCGAIAKGIDFEECSKLIHDANGLVVLAHPISLKQKGEELEKTIEYLVKNGLDGIEVFHSSHSPENIKEYLHYAEKYNLLISGGSDFHGPNTKPDVFLGRGKENIKIKQLTLLDEINKRKK